MRTRSLPVRPPAANDEHALGIDAAVAEQPLADGFGAHFRERVEFAAGHHERRPQRWLQGGNRIFRPIERRFALRRSGRFRNLRLAAQALAVELLQPIEPGDSASAS